MNANVMTVGPLRATQHDLELTILIKTWSAMLSLVARHSGPRIEPQSVTNFSVQESNRFADALRKGLDWLDKPEQQRPAASRGSAPFKTPVERARESLAFLATDARADVERIIALCDESRGLRAVQRYKDLGPQLTRGQGERGSGRAMRALPLGYVEPERPPTQYFTGTPGDTKNRTVVIATASSPAEQEKLSDDKRSIFELLAERAKVKGYCLGVVEFGRLLEVAKSHGFDAGAKSFVAALRQAAGDESLDGTVRGWVWGILGIVRKAKPPADAVPKRRTAERR